MQFFFELLGGTTATEGEIDPTAPPVFTPEQEAWLHHFVELAS